MKTYSAASSDLEQHIARMQTEHHGDLDGVTVLYFDFSAPPVSKSVAKRIATQKGKRGGTRVGAH